MFVPFLVILLFASNIFAIDDSDGIFATPLSDNIWHFSSEVYQKIIDGNNGNVIISPYSLASALAIISGGTRGKTFEQIAHALHLKADKNEIADKFSASSQEVQSGMGDSILKIANKVFVQNGFSIKPAFKDIVVNKFHSDIENVDFAENQKAAMSINVWVQDKTNDKIKDLIDPELLGVDTRVVLVNAVYFKGIWENRFDVESTHKSQFWIGENESVEVDFMRQINKFFYADIPDLDLSAIKMQYLNSNSSLLILLPNKRSGLSDLEKQLNSLDLSVISDRMAKQDVEVFLPKYKHEFQIEMTDPLKKLEIVDVFSNNADFSDLLTSPAPLKISAVVHKAFIDINEEGAEAAAATGSVVETRMGKARPDPVFKADHPFIFYILHDDNVLFMGRKSQ